MCRLEPFIIIAWLCTMPALASAETEKFAIIIGNNMGHNTARSLNFAEADAEKMQSVLEDLGGFDKNNIHMLQGAKAKEIKQVLHLVEQQIKAKQKNADHKTLLVFFYSGHAEEGVLELGRTSLSFEFVRQYLENSSANVRLAFLDSCESGRLIRKKGGKRSGGFQIRVADQISSSGYAIITSSATDEMSQESEEIRGSVFTHFLVSALRGSGDLSGDGRVTLEEAYHFVYGRTLARTAKSLGGSQHPMYHFRLEGRGTIVLTETQNNGSTVVINPPNSGRMIILDEINDIIIGESEVVGGQKSTVAINPGSYRAYLLSQDQTTVARFTLKANNQKTLGDSDFTPVLLEETVAKGGLFLKKRPAFQHELSLGGLWRLYPLEGTTSSFGATAHYRFITGQGLAPIVRIHWTAQQNTEPTGFNDLGAYVGLGYVLKLSANWSVHLSVLLGTGVVWQDKIESERRYSSSAGYIGLGGIRFNIKHFVLGLDIAGGGRLLKMHDNADWVHRADAQVALNLGILLGRL